MNSDWKLLPQNRQTYAIIGATMKVHQELGAGFLEGVYQDALEIELRQRGMPYSREHPVPICYRGIRLRTPYRADYLCFDSILVELKAVKMLTAVDVAQALHYMKATGHLGRTTYQFWIAAAPAPPFCQRVCPAGWAATAHRFIRHLPSPYIPIICGSSLFDFDQEARSRAVNPLGR